MDHSGQSDMNLELYNRFHNIMDRYKIDTKLHPKQWPEKYSWEALRMKKYERDSSFFWIMLTLAIMSLHGVFWYSLSTLIMWL